jgi:hypothetical protein
VDLTVCSYDALHVDNAPFLDELCGMVQERGLAPSQSTANAGKKRVFARCLPPLFEPCQLCSRSRFSEGPPVVYSGQLRDTGSQVRLVSGTPESYIHIVHFRGVRPRSLSLFTRQVAEVVRLRGLRENPHSHEFVYQASRDHNKRDRRRHLPRAEKQLSIVREIAVRFAL